MLGLDSKITKAIVDLINGYKKAEKIVIFGSRAGAGFSVTSDIDIAVFGREWSASDLNLVKHRLEEEVKTPLKFDLVNFYRLDKKDLKENILNQGVVIYESKPAQRTK